MAKVSYQGILLTVVDLECAQAFYEEVLGQVPEFVYEGQMVSFESGISLASENAYARWLAGEDTGLLTGVTFKVKRRPNTFQLYFEVDALDEFVKKIRENKSIEFIHEPIESAYGAWTVRFYDNDGHIIEVAESILMVAKRFLNEGMTIEQIAERFGDPIEVVEQLITQI